jgi:threonine dehydrogenase-like Zn-dependent dehydrogenase
MRGLWLENQQLSFRADLPRPEPPPGEAVVRVLRAGICNTDLEMVRGYYPFTGILGHEFVGRVEEAEDRA